MRRIALLVLAAVLALSSSSAAQQPSGGTWCSALAAGSPTIDVLGDSLSAGDSVADPGRRWHALLGQAFRTGGAPGAQVWTGGAIPGSATADYLPGAQYAGHIEFTVNHPDLILMGWGINDWAGGSTPPAQFQTQYQQIIDRVHALSPGSTIVLWHEPWVYASFAASRGPQSPYRDVIAWLAAVNGLSFFDAVWPFPGDNHYLTSMPDLVHLNENGQNTLFASMLGYVRGLCGRSG